MTAKTTIIAAINAKVGTGYSAWRIGLTHDLADRKKFWGGNGKAKRFPLECLDSRFLERRPRNRELFHQQGHKRWDWRRSGFQKNDLRLRLLD